MSALVVFKPYFVGYTAWQLFFLEIISDLSKELTTKLLISS